MAFDFGTWETSRNSFLKNLNLFYFLTTILTIKVRFLAKNRRNRTQQQTSVFAISRDKFIRIFLIYTTFVLISKLKTILIFVRYGLRLLNLSIPLRIFYKYKESTSKFLSTAFIAVCQRQRYRQAEIHGVWLLPDTTCSDWHLSRVG
jgi:hypothetical protein